jgi:hypothetical protein
MKFDDLDEKMRVYETALDLASCLKCSWSRESTGADSRG